MAYTLVTKTHDTIGKNKGIHKEGRTRKSSVFRPRRGLASGLGQQSTDSPTHNGTQKERLAPTPERMVDLTEPVEHIE